MVALSISCPVQLSLPIEQVSTKNDEKRLLEIKTPDLQTCPDKCDFENVNETQRAKAMTPVTTKSRFPQVIKTPHRKRKDTHVPMDGVCF